MTPKTKKTSFSNAFDENYALDSIRIFLDGMSDTTTLAVPQPILGLSEITIPLTGISVPETAAPNGSAAIFLVTKGQTSRENVKITDGIAPQLLSVTILENPEPRSTEDTLMIAFTEPVMLSSLGAWPLSIEGVSGDHISVSGKATTNNGGKSWLFVVTGNDNGAYIPVGGIASIKSGFNITDEALNALDPASPCAQGVKIAETPKPVPITLAEIRDNEGDGYADEIYLKFEKKLRPQDMLDSFAIYDQKLNNDTDFCCDDNAIYIENHRNNSELMAFSYDGSLLNRYRFDQRIIGLCSGYDAGVYAVSEAQCCNGHPY